MTSFSVFFDTNVLFGAYLNDLILSLAEAQLFRPLWSECVLDELRQNLLEYEQPADLVEKRITTMQRHFPDAMVKDFSDLEPSLTCASKDRHVLAAAVRARAQLLVTFNLRDFPDQATAQFDIEAVSPDLFLLDQLDLYPSAVMRVIRNLIESYSRPELDIDDLLVILSRAGAPKFADSVHAKR